MGRKSVTDKQRADLLESFRKDVEPGSPGSFRRAAEAAQVDRRTARRAWQRAWPGMKPIREVIEAEKVGARAALRKAELAAMLEERTKLAQESAIQSRAEEGSAVLLVTRAASVALGAMHSKQVFEHVAHLAVLTQENRPESLEAKAARSAMKDFALTLARLAQAAERGQRMARLLLGEATTILGGEVALRAVAPVKVDAATFAAELEAAQRAFDEHLALEAAKKDTTDGGTSALTN